jgi:hypothetical protein
LCHLREQIFANQKRFGVIPANTTLTPRPDGQPEYGGAKLPKWSNPVRYQGWHHRLRGEQSH